ncbi:DUF3644 domain-containing protein [Moorella sp. Hama-1]|uniref:DUF3644 domain-containing protein n=1 Tax=Moorella sp. Hama-1 TaxID=2138101 RepID=UPI000D647A6C|nr:DUF3644 domain-containing protein [Moorella sp. Hama-1]BCV22766.1 hypothetical protein hamaS1_28350 [Moorella sp. Hama-1]
MPRIKRDVVELKKRAINSLVLAIELFNRPHDQGRAEGVLILLHHAFEMLLKAIIKQRKGTIHEKGEKYTYTFDKCLEIAQNEIEVISTDERSTLSILDAHRDIAMHYYQEISENLLYVQAQAAVTLFDDLLNRIFAERLADCIPERVLPISTRPPKDLQLLIDSELTQVDVLLQAGSRKGIQAAARLRPILALATASRHNAERVTEAELRKAISRRRRGEEWSVLLPEIAQLKLDTQGEGIPIYYRIKKDADLAVRIAKDGEPVVGTLVKQEIDWFDKYSLSVSDIAQKLGLTVPKTRAYMFELNIWDDPEMYGEKKIKSQRYKRYTKKALDALRDIVKRLSIEDVWNKYGRAVMGMQK